jgi:hypothetical protein
MTFPTASQATPQVVKLEIAHEGGESGANGWAGISEPF